MVLTYIPNALLNSKASEQHIKFYVPLSEMHNIFTAVKSNLHYIRAHLFCSSLAQTQGV